MNFYMNKLDCTILKLISMLVTMEGILKSLRGSVLAMEQTSSSKRKSVGRKKAKSAKKQKKESKPKKDGPKAAEAKGNYFHCHAEGHWRRNYPKYLQSLKTKKDDKSSEGMLVIESNLTVSSTSSWILDFGSSAHICTSYIGEGGDGKVGEGS